MKVATRTRTVTARFSPETLAAAQKVAALTGRTVSSLSEHALTLYMRKNFPLAYDQNSVLQLSLHDAPQEPSK